jgi:hypothetical protein
MQPLSRFAVALVLVAGLAACSSFAANPSPATAQSPLAATIPASPLPLPTQQSVAAQAGGKFDLCMVLTKVDAEAVLAAPVGIPDSPADAAGANPHFANAACAYSVGDKSAVLNVNEHPAVDSAKLAFASLTGDGEAVVGIADAASWFAPMKQLIVLHGPYVYFVYTTGMPNSDKDSSIALAHRIAGRLP